MEERPRAGTRFAAQCVVEVEVEVAERWEGREMFRTAAVRSFQPSGSLLLPPSRAIRELNKPQSEIVESHESEVSEQLTC